MDISFRIRPRWKSGSSVIPQRQKPSETWSDMHATSSKSSGGPSTINISFTTALMVYYPLSTRQGGKLEREQEKDEFKILKTKGGMSPGKCVKTYHPDVVSILSELYVLISPYLANLAGSSMWWRTVKDRALMALCVGYLTLGRAQCQGPCLFQLSSRAHSEQGLCSFPCSR